MSCVTRDQLLQSAHDFCDAFARKRDIQTVLSYFSTTKQVSAIEYGLPTLAPFLGRSFEGIQGIRDYFEMIGSLLSFENMRFLEYVVDAQAAKVCVKGRARFKWLSTEKEWEETFTYTLDFDEEGKVTRYQVWADSGAAYLASRGQL